jgi:WD40 repeat protein
VPEATDDCGAQTSIQPWQSQQYQYSIDLHSDNNGDGGGEEQHEFGVWSVDFSAGGDQLAAGTSEGGLLVRRLTDDGRFLDTCKISKAHLADINSVKWLNDSLILTASDDSLIHLWDLRVARRTSSKPCGSLIGHTEVRN